MHRHPLGQRIDGIAHLARAASSMSRRSGLLVMALLPIFGGVCSQRLWKAWISSPSIIRQLRVRDRDAIESHPQYRLDHAERPAHRGLRRRDRCGSDLVDQPNLNAKKRRCRAYASPRCDRSLCHAESQAPKSASTTSMMVEAECYWSGATGPKLRAISLRSCSLDDRGLESPDMMFNGVRPIVDAVEDRTHPLALEWLRSEALLLPVSRHHLLQ